MITLCGSTYAKFVCSIILKQPSITTCCSSSIELNLQAHSILESNSLLILFFFFTILIISHQPFLFNKKRQKKIDFLQSIKFFVWCDDFTFWSDYGAGMRKNISANSNALFLYNSIYMIII